MTEGTHEALRLNRLKQVWEEGRTALGAIVTIPSVQVVPGARANPALRFHGKNSYGGSLTHG